MAGCNTEPGGRTDEGYDSPATRTEANAILEGNWTVTSTWGDPPEDAPIAIAIGETIVMTSQCVESEWTYSVVGNEVRTRFSPRTTCLRSLTRDERTVQDQITAGFTFAKDEGGGLKLETGVGPMTLDPAQGSPVKPAAEAAAAQPAPDGLTGHWRLAGIDGKPLDGPTGIALYFGNDRIEFDNCQQIAWRYLYADGEISTARTPAITVDVNPKRPPCAAPLPPQLAGMTTAIDAARRVETTPENGIRISGGAHSLTIFRQ